MDPETHGTPEGETARILGRFVQELELGDNVWAAPEVFRWRTNAVCGIPAGRGRIGRVFDRGTLGGHERRILSGLAFRLIGREHLAMQVIFVLPHHVKRRSRHAQPPAVDPKAMLAQLEDVECRMETNRAVVPDWQISRTRRRHLLAKEASPAASASSTMKISGSTAIAVANVKRACMPLE